MSAQAIDVVGEPAVIAKIVQLATSSGFTSSKPMPTDSISDALDAPFGVDEIRQVCETVTLVASTGVSVVGFLAAIKSLLSTSETDSGAEPAVEVKHTNGQRKIGKITKHTDLSTLEV
jgi:hypothetical protein